MKLSRLGEFGLIETIRKKFSRIIPASPAGIGDDSAVLSISPSSKVLATTDLLLEGVHFDLSYTDFYSLGWKAAAVNISDIAAMGGVPRSCLIALGIPSGISVEHIHEFYRGLSAGLRSQKTVLAGGDTSASRNRLVISVTILGESGRSSILKRSGARPGDTLFVTGTLGDSAAGLEILKKKSTGHGPRGNKYAVAEKKLIQKHLRPVPRVAVGRKLARSGCVSSMIDISDGLSSDLRHICTQSGAGAELFADRIPCSRDIKQVADILKKSPLEYALSGGEDYELLFTVPKRKLKQFNSLKIPSTAIGRMTGRNNIFLVDAQGNKKVLRPGGYEHFRRE